MKERTIILTSSIRVTAENDADLDRICNNLESAVSTAYDEGNITEGCHEDTSVGDITTDTEVCDDEENEGKDEG